jgi:hypothetical protein
MCRHHLQILAHERDIREIVGRRGIERGARRVKKWRMGGYRMGQSGRVRGSQRKRDLRGGRCKWRYAGEINDAPVLQG